MKKVAVIFTGGTISMAVDERIKAAIPALSDKEIMERVSGIEKIAEVVPVHYGSLPGPHITPDIMMHLASVVREQLADPTICGVVVTHGTDTLEETAFLLDTVLDFQKPIVITGAMRNSSELGYDGPANLSAAVCTAVSPESSGQGVLVVMNNQVHAAEEVTKSHTLDLNTFQSLDFGPLGIVDQDVVIYYRKKHQSYPFSTTSIESKIALIKTVAGMDSDIIYYYLKSGYKGIVIEGMGRGNVPPRMVAGIAKAIEQKIPVVLVSRCPKGRVLDSYGYEGGGKGLRSLGAILGDNLSGPKARLKLMAILGTTSKVDEVKRLFEKDLYKKI